MATRTTAMDKKTSSLMFRQITPPHGWKEDSTSYYLRLTLPGFETKDVKIHMDKYDHLIVRGDRQLSERKYITFEETFKVPNDADLEESSGLFEENQIYCITIPKKQIGHAITMPKVDNPKGKDNKIGSFHNYDNIKYPEEITEQNTGMIGNNKKNPLGVITGHKYKRRIAFIGAMLVALIVVGVVFLIVKLRHH